MTQTQQPQSLAAYSCRTTNGWWLHHNILRLNIDINIDDLWSTNKIPKPQERFLMTDLQFHITPAWFCDKCVISLTYGHAPKAQSFNNFLNIFMPIM